MPPIGRPRQFDTDQALDRALDAFWAHGYASTSLADLIDAMGLQKGSIYKAFGDKRSLFLAALDRYLTAALDASARVLDKPDPRAAVEAWLTGALGLCTDAAACRKGCFAVNAVVELAPHDQAVADRLTQHFTDLEALLAARLTEAQADGHLRKGSTPSELTAMLVVVAMGVGVDAKRAKANAARAKGVLASTLAALWADPAAKPKK